MGEMTFAEFYCLANTSILKGPSDQAVFKDLWSREVRNEMQWGYEVTDGEWQCYAHRATGHHPIESWQYFYCGATCCAWTRIGMLDMQFRQLFTEMFGEREYSEWLDISLCVKGLLAQATLREHSADDRHPWRPRSARCSTNSADYIITHYREDPWMGRFEIQELIFHRQSQRIVYRGTVQGIVDLQMMPKNHDLVMEPVEWQTQLSYQQQ